MRDSQPGETNICMSAKCERPVKATVTIRYRTHGDEHLMVYGYCGFHGIDRISKTDPSVVDEIVFKAADSVTPMYLINGASI